MDKVKVFHKLYKLPDFTSNFMVVLAKLFYIQFLINFPFFNRARIPNFVEADQETYFQQLSPHVLPSIHENNSLSSLILYRISYSTYTSLIYFLLCHTEDQKRLQVLTPLSSQSNVTKHKFISLLAVQYDIVIGLSHSGVRRKNFRRGGGSRQGVRPRRGTGGRSPADGGEFSKICKKIPEENCKKCCIFAYFAKNFQNTW